MTASILLVEEFRSPTDAILPSLQKKKYEVSLARNEKEAIQRATSETPDLIILNATSPRIDGAKICQALHESMAEIPVMLILKGTEVAGATVVLTPPFTSRKLFNRIRSILKSDGGKTLLLVEEAESSIDWILPSLGEKQYEVLLARSEQEAIQRATSETPNLIIVNATSPRIDGPRICRALHESVAGIPIVLILKDKGVVGATVILTSPFTSRKLFNRIRSILKSDEGKILQAGGLTLSLGTRRVSNGTKERRLNPKELALLKVFMRSPGRVLSRKFLMKKIWKTDYTGDTRTLDVHIRWLREKIEKNPSSPLYLRTVRGVGYRFDIPEEKDKETK